MDHTFLPLCHATNRAGIDDVTRAGYRQVYLGAMLPHQIKSLKVLSGERVPSPAVKGSGSVISSPTGVRDGAPAGNAFWHILKATELSFLHLYADALSSSYSVSCHIWGQGRGLG